MTEQTKISDDLVINNKARLGQGAHGMVFQGTYKNSPCAAKLLNHVGMGLLLDFPIDPSSGIIKDLVQKLNHECEFLKTFKHLNIVQYLATCVHPESGTAILVLELMDCSLKAYFRSGRVDETPYDDLTKLSLSKDVASGLAYIHEQNIVHRDLCGDNILLKFECNQIGRKIPTAKISDFGMARLLDSSAASLSTISHRLGYLAPEGPLEAYDQSLDVFSLGVVMIQIDQKLITISSAEDRSYHLAQIPGFNSLKALIKDCIREKARRPAASEVCECCMPITTTVTMVILFI